MRGIPLKHDINKSFIDNYKHIKRNDAILLHTYVLYRIIHAAKI